MTIEQKFDLLGVDNAPGQEGLQQAEILEIRGEKLHGAPVDFSHGDVDAHPPTPGGLALFSHGVAAGGRQAYTPYRGNPDILQDVAEKLSKFTGADIDSTKNIILTNGTQGALFLSMGASIMPGDKVAIVEPDYFANRKMVEFLGGEMIPVQMKYRHTLSGSGIDLTALENVFKNEVKLFLFSNPNNPVGCIYSYEELCAIGDLAAQYGVTLIVDELYCRQIYAHQTYTHLCSLAKAPENLITILGPSKTESLSGYRLGVAFGTAAVIKRMEQLQAIISLRCAGYNQAVFGGWFAEPEGWMARRIKHHQDIRDALMEILQGVEGVSARPSEGGSYLFITIPELDVSLHDFVKIVRELAEVIVTPGTEFGPQFSHEFRINFSQDKEKAVAGIKRLLEILERYRKQ